jgi:hypothetical protein
MMAYGCPVSDNEPHMTERPAFLRMRIIFRLDYDSSALLCEMGTTSRLSTTQPPCMHKDRDRDWTGCCIHLGTCSSERIRFVGAWSAWWLAGLGLSLLLLLCLLTRGGPRGVVPLGRRWRLLAHATTLWGGLCRAARLLLAPPAPTSARGGAGGWTAASAGRGRCRSHPRPWRQPEGPAPTTPRSFPRHCWRRPPDTLAWFPSRGSTRRLGRRYRSPLGNTRRPRGPWHGASPFPASTLL